MLAVLEDAGQSEDAAEDGGRWRERYRLDRIKEFIQDARRCKDTAEDVGSWAGPRKGCCMLQTSEH